MVYRLDFKPQLGESESAYYQMYEDYGWERVFICNNFVCFRKAVVEGENMEIYSDNQTKLEMIGRIFKRRFVVFIPLMLIVFKNAIHPRYIDDPLLWFWRMLALAYLLILIYCGIGFYTLRKRYKKEK